MKKILIVTFWFLPGISPANRRILALINHLQYRGWEPFVLTVKPQYYGRRDHLDENPANARNVKLIRTLAIAPCYSGNWGVGESLVTKLKRGFFNRVFLPDHAAGWILHAFHEGSKLLKEMRFQAIISTGPPVSAHIVAYLLRRRNNIAWVVDLRDPMLGQGGETRVARKGIMTWFEKCIATNSSLLISPYSFVLERLSNLYDADDSKLLLVSNGFDPKIQNKLAWSNETPSAPVAKDKLVILHAGQLLYPFRQKTTKNLIQGLKLLVEECPESKDVIRLLFYGTFPEAARKIIKEWSLESMFHIQRYIPNKSVLSRERDCTVLLLISGTEWEIPGKVFEYFEAQRPILCLSKPNSGIAHLIRVTRTGIVASCDDPGQIKHQLHNLLLDFRAHGTIEYRPRKTSLMKYSWNSAMNQLIDRIESIVGGGDAPRNARRCSQ